MIGRRFVSGGGELTGGGGSGDGSVAASTRVDAVAGGVLGEPKHLGAVGEERAVAFGGEEGGSGVEHGQMRHELDRGLALVAGEHTDAREEIVIREAGGESQNVRVHTSMDHGVFWVSATALNRIRTSPRTGFRARECVGAEAAQRGTNAFQARF